MSLYNAEISAGSLMPLESRRVAELLLAAPTEEQWNQALRSDNLLQKRTPATARRMARLIRNRLRTLDEEGLRLILQSDQQVSVQMLLAAAIKHSQLLGDFMRDVYAFRLRKLERDLDAKDWEAFLAECAHRDPSCASWSATTKAKLFQVIVRILAEAKYLDGTRSMKLTPKSPHPAVARYLKERGENSVLAAMEQDR